MLVIISDLHLTDGTSGSTISAGAFHLLAERLEDLAIRASCRDDGSYRPIDRIDLVLLGDVLDVVRSTRWLEGRIRPWGDPQSPEMVEMVSAITGKILQQNESALSVFRSLAGDGAIRISPANHLARPVPSADGQSVPVHIHYLVGNHDWFYHLPGSNYHMLRRQIVSHLGLANRHDRPFPHDPRESDELLEVMRRHKVFARHGDIYDPFNYDGDRDSSSLGDVIVIELLNRFTLQVEAQFGADLPSATVHGLREIDNIRPLLLVPVWIDGLLERTCPISSMRQQVKKIWDTLADEFLEIAFVRARDTWSPVDIVDGLQRALKFSKRLNVGWASWIASWLAKLRGADQGSYYQHAMAEQEFRNRRAKHIVYGHTHHSETVPLDASYAEGCVLDQVYFNSGTWRRVHKQTQLSPAEHEFIATDTMTYLAFFQGNERKGRSYETWSGALAAGPMHESVHRLDQGVASHANGQSFPASAVHEHRPHFATSAAHAPVIPTRRV